MNVKKNVFFGSNVLLPIIVGTFAYLLCRPDTYVSAMIYHLIGFDDITVYIPSLTVSRFIRFYFADIMWGYALIYALYYFQDEKTFNHIPLVVGISFEVLIELFQLLPMINGTFDVMDIILEAIASIIAYYLIMKWRKTHEKEI